MRTNKWINVSITVNQYNNNVNQHVDETVEAREEETIN